MKNNVARLIPILVCTLGTGTIVSALELPNTQELRVAIHREVRKRADRIAWVDFSDPAAAGLTYSSTGDELAIGPGRWPEQNAARLFHGSLRGKPVDIPQSGFTLCCWLRINGFDQTTDNPLGCVMSMGDGWRDGWRLLVKPREGQKAVLSFTVGHPGGGSSVNCGGRFSMGEWRHVAVTRDHETLAVWIDGRLWSEAPVTMPYTTPKKPHALGIGACCSDGIGALDFEIADLAFFSAALPAEVLKRLHNPGDALAGYALAGLRIADNLRREGRSEEARQAYAVLASREDAPLHCRARAMLAAGDMRRDAKRYAAARRAYEKTREFFTGKHEAFRVDALERLRNIETLADGAPLRDERRRRIDRISHATPWFFVAPDGDDQGPGTAERPFRTLERARDAVRERRKREPLPAGGVAVMLKGGVYGRETHSLALTDEDSGTATAPIMYRAVPGETPILRGGRAISGFGPLTDPVGKQRIPAAAQQHVLQADLKAAGVEDFGKLRPRGRGIGITHDPDVPAHLELFFDGRPMSLARWPNDTPKMSERFTTMDLSGQETSRDGGRTIAKESDFFSYTNPRQDAWADEPDAWVFGCWQYMFFACYKQVARVDTEKRRIYIDWNRKTPQELKRKEFAHGAPYQGINLLCELDSPGEWYLDRTSGVLFFWPPSEINESEAVVSVLEKPIITLDDASHVVFRGLTLEAGRQHGVVIKDGENVLLAGCVIRNMGVTGVIIDGGAGHELIGCDLANLGDAGVKLEGGNIEKLIPSGHLVENCHIHHYARWNRVGYQPAVEMKGVGSRVSHCLVHDAPHQAFLVHDNDNIVEYSEIHDVCHEAGDAGAYYMYGGVSKQALLELGQVVRYNYWHDLPQNDTFKKVGCITRMCIYIDSFNSNITVYGNVFDKCDFNSGAVFFGACDNRVENNIFHRCFKGVNLTDRTWLYEKVNKAPNFVIDAYLAKAAANPVWARRYPRLATFPPQAEDTSAFLAGNVVARNIGYQCKTFISGQERTMNLTRIEQNWNEGDPGFRDADNGDFRIRPDSPVFAEIGFEALPLDRIGLYNDELRANWPVRHESGSYETRLVGDSVKRTPTAEMPVCRAYRRTAPITIDGRLDPAEWDGLEKARATVLNQTPSNNPTQARPSYAWLRRDEKCLYIALLNELEPGQTPRPRAGDASWWQDLDMAEIIFEGPFGENADDWWPRDRRHGPLFYLVGDSAGHFGSIAIADLPPARAKGLRGAVAYGAVSEAGRWTAEWRVPLAALGLDPAKTEACCFNIGVLKPGTQPPPGAKGELPAGDKWAVWVGTNAANWEVWNAGSLRLKEK